MHQYMHQFQSGSVFQYFKVRWKVFVSLNFVLDVAMHSTLCRPLISAATTTDTRAAVAAAAGAARCVNQKIFTPTCPNKRTKLTDQRQRPAAFVCFIYRHFATPRRSVGLEMTERSVINRHLTGNSSVGSATGARPFDELQACTLISYARPEQSTNR